MQYLQLRHLRYVVLSMVLIISANQLQAQSEEDQGDPEKNSLQDGSWSLKFQINSNFNLS